MSRFDAIVVGGGLVGAACTDALAGEGLRVCLLERGPFLREASWAGAGILHPIHPWSYPEPLQRLLRLAAAEHPRLAADLQRRTGIDVELERSGLLVMGDAIEPLAAWCGDEIPHRRVRASAEAPEIRLAGDALFLPEACHVKSHRLGRALLAGARARGAVLRDHTPVIELAAGAVRTPGGVLHADRIVLCAGAWSAALRRGLAVKPVRGQILLFRGRLRRMAVFPEGDYAVPRRGGLLLYGSTLEDAGFDSRPTAAGHAELLAAAQRTLGLGEESLLAAWAGLRPGSTSGLPYIGSDPEHEGVVLACGHYRNGILLAPLTARLVADLALGRDPGLDLAPFAPGPGGNSQS